jgi:hypothetical protein
VQGCLCIGGLPIYIVDPIFTGFPFILRAFRLLAAEFAPRKVNRHVLNKMSRQEGLQPFEQSRVPFGPKEQCSLFTETTLRFNPYRC